MKTADEIIQAGAELAVEIGTLSTSERINVLNTIRAALHEISPFSAEPVDCVLWVSAEDVAANDYNPNAVAPPEMELLEHSIAEDGYTQPIVTWLRDDSTREVVDGFHRHRIGCESLDVQERIHGYLPVTSINRDRVDRGDRMASTIRHNRARGRHRVDGMSEIVLELVKRKWSDKRIARELGMEPDEVLRLKQVGGLAEIFADEDFSEAWGVNDEADMD